MSVRAQIGISDFGAATLSEFSVAKKGTKAAFPEVE
jgi:hypothetical protein